jgi:hypothetical protein
MTEQALGTIVFYGDEKHSEPLERVTIWGAFLVSEENDGLLNLWVPTIFYRATPRRPLRLGDRGENLEIALFKKVGGSEHLVWSSDSFVNNPEGLAEFVSFSGQIKLNVFPWGTGHYVVRAFANTDTIADGELEMIQSSVNRISAM